MKKIICMIFILILSTSLFAEDFSLTKSYMPKKSPKVDLAFGLLQYSAWLLIDLDTVLTYRTINRYGLNAESTPFWRSILDKPALVFVVDMVIKIGIIWGTTKLFKKNKFLAYCAIVLVNVVQIYCVNTHLIHSRKR